MKARAILALFTAFATLATVQADIFVTKDQQQIRGEMLSSNDKEYKVKTPYGNLTIPKDKVVRHRPESYVFHLKDGTMQRVEILSQTSTNYEVKLLGQEKTFAKADIKKVDPQPILSQADRQKLGLAHRTALNLLMNKEYEKSIKIYRQILSQLPFDETALYNIACALSLQGDKDTAVKYLQRSLEAGFVSFDHIRLDEDLDNIRDHAGYKKLMAREDEFEKIAMDKRVEALYAQFKEKDVDVSQYKRFYDKERNFLYLHTREESDLKVLRDGFNAFAAYHWNNYMVNKPRRTLYIVLLTEEDTKKMLPSRVGGFYNRAINTLVCGDLPSWQLLKTSVVYHEFTHALHIADMLVRRQNHPIWFVEGLGTLYETADHEDGKVLPKDNMRLRQIQAAVKLNRVPPIRTMMRLPRQPFMQNAALFYAYSRYLMLYLDEKGLVDDYYNLYTDKEMYAKNQTGEDALEQLLGKPLEAIDKDFRKWVMQQKPPAIPSFGIATKVKDNQVEITQVAKKSGAEKAGIKKGDILRTIDGQAITAGNDIVRAISMKNVGDSMEVIVDRKGDVQTLVVVLGARKMAAIRGPQKRAWLGLTISEPASGGEGVTITKVEPKSPAAKAKLRVGDTILEMGGKKLEKKSDYFDAFKKIKAGKHVKMKIKTEAGGTKEVRVKSAAI